MNKKTILGLLMTALMLLVACTSSTNTQEQNTELNIPAETTTVIEDTDTQKTVSLDKVKMHNSKEDCWIVFENKVYDISNFIPKLEKNIADVCGTSDFETIFFGEYETSKLDIFYKESIYVGDLE